MTVDGNRSQTIPTALFFLALASGGCFGPAGEHVAAGVDESACEGCAAEGVDGGPWRPAPGTSWQWQLTGPLDASLDVAMVDVDLFETSSATIASLQAAGRVVVCYFSAGTWENWRDDRDAFPQQALGAVLPDWPDERWLDIRDERVLDAQRTRLDLAADRGCDGVEPDNVDAWDNDSGLDLSAGDQLVYNRAIAHEAHARGLSVGLKNDLAQVPALVDEFDWALVESCAEWDECESLAPFVEAGKAVFQVEYADPGDERDLADRVCAQANALDHDALIKHEDLDAYRLACR